MNEARDKFHNDDFKRQDNNLSIWHILFVLAFACLIGALVLSVLILNLIK